MSTNDYLNLIAAHENRIKELRKELEAVKAECERLKDVVGNIMEKHGNK